MGKNGYHSCVVSEYARYCLITGHVKLSTGNLRQTGRAAFYVGPPHFPAFICVITLPICHLRKQYRHNISNLCGLSSYPLNALLLTYGIVLFYIAREM